jgi:hypothetical protein
VNFVTDASQNGVYKTHQICRIMNLFHEYSMIKGESEKQFIVFCYVQDNIGSLMKGKLIQKQIPFCDVHVSGSTVK